MASRKRAAALPVGADKATRSGTTIFNSWSNAKTRTTVVVLPVPGPPLITAKGRRTANAAASRCSIASVTTGKTTDSARFS